MRVLGLDMGERFIGVAVSDSNGRMAVPLEVVERRGRLAGLAEVAGLAEEAGAEMIVVGMPFSLDGSMGPQADRIQADVALLAKETSLPIEYADERLSSRAALGLVAHKGRRRNKGRLDASAAAVILQSWLDAR